MDNVKEEAKRIEPKIIGWFRELHGIPEIGEDLPKTTAFVKKILDELGISYNTYSNSGIRAVIEGGQPGGTIAFRADMDALNVKEETGLAYASKHEGAMHACGHDAHTAMLLGAAELLSKCRESLKGKVVLLFQPAEETTGGAKLMVEEGCLKNPDADMFVAFHAGKLFPGIENGQIGYKKGSMMASVDSFFVKVKGKGGHGAYPDECIDPIPIACQIIQSLQTIVSRNIKPVHGAVVTVGQLHAGTMVNIIPDVAEFGGTIRTLDKDDREFIEERLPEMIKCIAKANGAEAEVRMVKYYPVTKTDGRAVDFFVKSAAKIVGEENMIEITEAATGTEDVAYYLEAVPGAFGILGSLAPHSDGLCYPHHNSKFRIAEDCLYVGSAVYAQCAVDFLK